MSKLADALRQIKVYNDHDLLRRFGRRGKDVSVSYTPYEHRMVSSQGARVYSPSHKTDPDAHFLDNGQMAFAGNLKISVPKAIAWASKTYGIAEWATSPFGRTSKIPKYVLDAAKNAVKS